MSYKHDGYKSRKFWYTVGLTMAACVLVYFAKISDGSWKDVIETIVATYLASNVGERWAAGREGKHEDKQQS